MNAFLAGDKCDAVGGASQFCPGEFNVSLSIFLFCLKQAWLEDSRLFSIEHDRFSQCSNEGRVC